MIQLPNALIQTDFHDSVIDNKKNDSIGLGSPTDSITYRRQKEIAGGIMKMWEQGGGNLQSSGEMSDMSLPCHTEMYVCSCEKIIPPLA